MKKIFLFLFLALSISVAAQKTYSIENNLILNTVNQGLKADSVLVRGVDKIVKFVPRSEFGSGGSTPVTGDPDNLPKINSTGDGLVNSHISDYGDRVVISNSVDIDNYVPNTSGLKFANLKNQTLATTTNYATGITLPDNIIFDGSGNAFVSTGVSTIVKILPDGTTSTFATTGGVVTKLGLGSFGTIYALNSTFNQVQKISADGTTVTTLGSTGSGPKDMVVDMWGDIYVVNSGDNTVSYIPSYGGSSVFGTTGENPSGIVKTMGGDIYVTNKNDNSITKMDYAGASSTFASVGPSPQDITIAPDGNLYVINTGDGSVSKVTMGGSSSVIGTTGANPSGIIADTDNNIYVSNSSSDNVTKITPAGVTTIYGTTGGSPSSIAFRSGSIYTSDRFNTGISKLSPPPLAKVLTLDGEGNVIKDSKDYVAIDNLKTLNNQSLIGQGNLVVAPTLQQIFDVSNSLYVTKNSSSFNFTETNFNLGILSSYFGSNFKASMSEASLQNYSSQDILSNVRVGYNGVYISTNDENTGKGFQFRFVQPSGYNYLSAVVVPLPQANGTFYLPLKIDGQSADINGDVKTGGLAVDNSTTSTLSASTLTSTYPDTVNGFRVHCTSISGGALTYEKTEAGWIQYPITLTP